MTDYTRLFWDFMQARLPEWWEKYLRWIDFVKITKLWPEYHEVFDAQLSLANLAEFIVAEYEKRSDMFFEEYPNIGKDGHNHPANPCSICNGTGFIVKPEWAEVVKVIEGKEGKE
jgi:hypothetical protein